MSQKSQFKVFLESLDCDFRVVLMRIAEVERDESKTPMERSIELAELESRRCSIQSMRCAACGDQEGELKFLGEKNKWQQRLKVAVAARSQDLLPKILDKQIESAQVSDELENLT